MAKHLEGKSLRNKRQGLQAISDTQGSADNFCKIFSRILGITISSSNTPEIYELINRIHTSGNDATQSAKSYYMRLRPYVKLNEATSYPEDEESLRNNGSYPSGHASTGWLIGLVLSEVTRSQQDYLLNRAYTYGQGRVITGYHWQTDVDYGRMVGCAVYAHLHNDSEFTAQMYKAVEEFKSVSTAIQTISSDTLNTEAPIYNLNGTRIIGKPTHHGIYIQNNHKIAY